jgi:hypothetical protein
MPIDNRRQNVRLHDTQVLRAISIGCINSCGRGLTASAATFEFRALTMLLVQYARRNLPSTFTFTSIQINKNYQSAMHVDAYNLGPSYIVGLGDYDGGRLWLHDSSGGCAVDIKGKFFLFDGNNPHQTLPFEGTRYSLIFYTNQSHSLLKDADSQFLRDVGFPFPVEFEEKLEYAPKQARLSLAKAAFASWLMDDANAALMAIGRRDGERSSLRIAAIPQQESSTWEQVMRKRTPGRIIMETQNCQQAAACAARIALAAAGDAIDAVAQCTKLTRRRGSANKFILPRVTPQMKEAVQGRPFMDREEHGSVIYRVLQDTVFVNELDKVVVEYYNWSAFGTCDDSELADADVFWSPWDEIQGFADWSQGKAAAAAAAVAMYAAVVAAAASSAADSASRGVLEDQAVRVYWPLDKAWYAGTVTSRHGCDEGPDKHLVEYEDGTEEWLVLSEELVMYAGRVTQQMQALAGLSFVDTEDADGVVFKVLPAARHPVYINQFDQITVRTHLCVDLLCFAAEEVLAGRVLQLEPAR